MLEEDGDNNKVWLSLGEVDDWGEYFDEIEIIASFSGVFSFWSLLLVLLFVELLVFDKCNDVEVEGWLKFV